MHWSEYRRLAGVVDVAGPVAGGGYTVSAGGRLLRFNPGTGTLTPFARGPAGYLTRTGEPYLTAVGPAAGPAVGPAVGPGAGPAGGSAAGTGCPFADSQLFAIEPAKAPSVIEIAADGRARQFAALPAGMFLDGITFDGTGGFGHRLLVTGTASGRTSVFAIDCNGRVSVLASGAPPVEGGIVVAPAGFGGFGGDLIAPNETSGRVWAITPSGRAVLLVTSGLPYGGDIGVESAGFVPAGFGSSSAAFLADRFSGLGNKHPGDNVLLRLSGAALLSAGVRAGDLLVAAEGGALTIDVRCARSCTVRYIADGPRIAHAEGHLVVTG